MKISKKWKNQSEILSFYTSVPKIMITCYTVHMTVHMTHDGCNCYFSFWAIFYPSPPLTTRTRKISKKKKKMKKAPGDIIILHKCTKNHDHVLCCSWDMVCDGCNCYFSFWAIFCTFTPLRARKIKLKKNAWRYHHFTLVYQNSWLYAILFLRYDVVCNSS